jgi:hypothetical protein
MQRRDEDEWYLNDAEEILLCRPLMSLDASVDPPEGPVAGLLDPRAHHSRLHLHMILEIRLEADPVEGEDERYAYK